MTEQYQAFDLSRRSGDLHGRRGCKGRSPCKNHVRVFGAVVSAVMWYGTSGNMRNRIA
jgi:hypothetical protein